MPLVKNLDEFNRLQNELNSMKRQVIEFMDTTAYQYYKLLDQLEEESWDHDIQLEEPVFYEWLKDQMSENRYYWYDSGCTWSPAASVRRVWNDDNTLKSTD